MKNYTKERSLSTLAALLTFALFAIGILSVLLGGANVYQRLNQRDQNSYDSRTCAQYIATKLRQAPSPGAVAVAPFGDGDGLFITETIGDCAYLTRVYCHDGWLMELFTVVGGEFSPEDGEKILPLRTLSLTRDGSLVSVQLTDLDNTSQRLTLHIRGGSAP